MYGSNDQYLKTNYLLYLNDDKDMKLIKLIASIQNGPIGKSQFRFFYLNSDLDDASNYEIKIENFSKSFGKIIEIENILKQNISTINSESKYNEVNFDEYTVNIKNKFSNENMSTNVRFGNGVSYHVYFV